MWESSCFEAVASSRLVLGVKHKAHIPRRKVMQLLVELRMLFILISLVQGRQYHSWHTSIKTASGMRKVQNNKHYQNQLIMSRISQIESPEGILESCVNVVAEIRGDEVCDDSPDSHYTTNLPGSNTEPSTNVKTTSWILFFLPLYVLHFSHSKMCAGYNDVTLRFLKIFAFSCIVVSELIW